MTDQQRCVHCGHDKKRHGSTGCFDLVDGGERYCPCDFVEPAVPEHQNEPCQHQSSPEHAFCIKCGAWLDDSSAPHIRTQPAITPWADRYDLEDHKEIVREAILGESPQIPERWKAEYEAQLEKQPRTLVSLDFCGIVEELGRVESALAAERARREKLEAILWNVKLHIESTGYGEYWEAESILLATINAALAHSTQKEK